MTHRRAGARSERAARAIAAAVLAFAFVAALRAFDVSPENRVKAAVIAKIPAFVTWPAAAMAEQQPLALCVAAPNRFGDDLAALVAGEKVDGHDLAVQVVTTVDQVARCQVLFAPSRAGGAKHPLLARAQTLPVLTIGDDPAFLDEGGIINLKVVDGRVRFEVDLAAARRAGLEISSQLLRLAVSVRGST